MRGGSTESVVVPGPRSSREGSNPPVVGSRTDLGGEYRESVPDQRRRHLPCKGFAVANPNALAAERFSDGRKIGSAEVHGESGKLRAALLHLDQAKLGVDEDDNGDGQLQVADRGKFAQEHLQAGIAHGRDDRADERRGAIDAAGLALAAEDMRRLPGLANPAAGAN